jgi:hypothetical protein
MAALRVRLNAAIRHSLRGRFVDSRLRILAGPLYNLLVGLELAMVRGADTILPLPQGGDPRLLTALTAVVKTFERPRMVRRVVVSIRRLYPGLRVVVVDDSRQLTRLRGVETVALPFESGVSAGRSAGLARTETPYFLNLDDDFVFYRHTDLVAALRLMEANPEIDIMGGEVVHLPLFHTTDYRQVGLFRTNATPVMPLGSLIGGLPVYDKVANFFLARTERLRLVDWDPALKRMEHADFFTRARGVLTSVHNTELKCLHAGTPFDTAYMVHRLDLAGDAAVLRERYGR